ncbi:MAG: penicillin acylase family protein [Acidobacteria bacterium]|nr:penicillin acylase family protein [Acidobacteriota bacterium]
MKVVNWVLLALVAAVAGLVGWYVWLPGAKTSGTLQAPVSKQVQINRDGLGTPHIEAGSIEDALFAQGYATAQDRMWQMDSLRRLAAGELSEVAGKAALELDFRSRKLRIRRIAEFWRGRMPARDKALVAAYARGVNHYIETNKGKWGPEFAVMGYEPRPWGVTDSLMCALQMHRTLSGHWEQDLMKGRMLTGGDKAKVNFLFPVRSGMEPAPGSNAWAIAGSRTTTGKPVLANDPHLEWTMPATWYMAHLQAPGLNVAGATLPGVPGVVIGHNERIAWGITALQFDNMDLYVENIDPRTGRYQFKGQTLQAEREVEWIGVKGGKAIQTATWVTVHGPLAVSEGQTQMALKWGAAVADGFDFPLVALDQARNWTEFRAAAARFTGPNINLVYADVDGNIGWQVAGRLPARVGFDGDVPLDGASGKAEWAGFVPFEQLPSEFNPKAGLVVSANQNGFKEKEPFQVSGFFASHHRAKAIADRIASRPKWKPEEMLVIQRDVYSAFLKYVADEAVRAAARRGEQNPMAREGVRVLTGWDGQMRAEAAAPMLATLLYQHIRRAAAEQASPKEGANYKTYMAPAVVEKLLRERPKGWFDDFDMMLANRLADAVEEGKRMQGRNPERWQYGRVNEVTIAHPVAGRIGWIAPYFNIGPVGLSGTGTSINAATPRLGPSMRFVADLSDWEASRMNVTTGQSGHIFSGHYKDQWEAYRAGSSFPLQFGRVESRGTLTLQP